MAAKEELLAQLRELKTQGLNFGDIVPVHAEDNTPRQDDGFNVDIAGEYGVTDGSIHLHGRADGSDEIVMWDSAEWVEDPSLVYVIVNAIVAGFRDGSDAIRARIAAAGADDEEAAEYELPDGVTLDRRPLPTDIPEGHVALVLQIDNTYEKYEDVQTFASVTVPVPPADEESDEYDTWMNNHVIDALTGVGHTDGDSWYDLEVLESSNPDLIPVGQTWDWGY